MNKIKLVYDVVMKLKEKEKFAGKLVAEGLKEGKKVLDANVDFEKNFANGVFKSDVSIKVDCDKKKFKHESKTEMECGESSCGKSHKQMFEHIHKVHHYDKSNCCHGKGKLSKLAFGLNVLHNMKLEELSDDKIQLSLSLDSISKELCEGIHKEIVEKCQKKHANMFKNCDNLDKHNGDIELIVNDKKEIEKALLKIYGLKNNGKEDVVFAEFKGQVDLFE
ncbi:MAG: hypothetical protein ABF289_05920 [Clostridiales bacterium]